MRQKLYTYDVAENTCSYETMCSSYNFTEHFVHDDAKVAIEETAAAASVSTDYCHKTA